MGDLPHSPFKPDQLLADRYVITRVDHISGFTALYQARDRQSDELDDLRAIKEENIQPSLADSLQAQTENFQGKVELLKTLRHPAIARTYDGFANGDQGYLVMAYIRGKDLEAVLNVASEFLPVKTAHQWALELGNALNYLHTHRPGPIIFRDLKPSNIMIDHEQRAWLIDFGIAGIFEREESSPPLGSDGYAAPEQYAGVVNPAIDMYAFGAMLHHILTRNDPRLQAPFSFGKRSIRSYNPNVPWPFVQVVMRALAYDPKDRFDSMAEMLEALCQIEPDKE